MKINQKGINLIKHFESLHDGDLKTIGLQPKLCSANIWTVGYGHALVDPLTKRFLKGDKDKLKAYNMYPSMTIEEAEFLLKMDLQIYERAVKNLVKSKLNENQFSALVSFVFNVGGTNFASSTLLKKVNKNPNDGSIANEFVKWNKARVGGKLTILRGLTRRREVETELYFSK